MLRSGRLTGDPDVLEYYKNDHAKKPIRIIDLNLCQQVDAGLTFNKKEFENSYIFDINTIDRIFYLVADSEEDMNKWVRCICDICGFNPTEEGGSGFRFVYVVSFIICVWVFRLCVCLCITCTQCLWGLEEGVDPLDCSYRWF